MRAQNSGGCHKRLLKLVRFAASNLGVRGEGLGHLNLVCKEVVWYAEGPMQGNGRHADPQRCEEDSPHAAHTLLPQRGLLLICSCNSAEGQGHE